MTKALLIIDVQNDFVEGGSLAVANGKRVAAAASALVEVYTAGAADYSVVVATQDWHIKPGDHFSPAPDFVNSWPVHCLAEDEGSAIVAVLQAALSAAERAGKPLHYIHKGMFEAAYSGFEGVDEDNGLTLVQVLERYGVDEVEVIGLATDYCVRQTALDAAQAGFTTTVLQDYIAGINAEKVATTLTEEFPAAGIAVK